MLSWLHARKRICVCAKKRCFALVRLRKEKMRRRMRSDVGMLSWWRPHAVMVACAYTHTLTRRENLQLQYKDVLP